MIARRGVLAILSFSLTSCGVISSPPVSWETAYTAAIRDATSLTADKVRPLRALPSTDTVTVVSWVSESQLPCAEGKNSCVVTTGHYPLWVTLHGEVQSKCRSWNLTGTSLRNRLEQLLGLPTNKSPPFQKSKFIVLEVKLNAIERPCLGVNQAPSETFCTVESKAETSAQVRHLVTEKLVEAKAMGSSTTTAYPFTGLGYTYDWGASADRHHYGATEFWVMPNSTVSVNQIVDSNTYCQ